MSKLSRTGHALYSGQVSIDFVGRRRLWYAISAVIVLVAVLSTGIPNADDPTVNTSGGDSLRVTTEPLTNEESREVASRIADAVGVDVAEDISSQLIGPSWGEQVASRAL